ncbi:uncharacterized protein N7483_012384 [Penicillium malachiteum]|uniref:uncharacterized protein n=1 Tax=Penicillium malachiteum TaxID=1324776 RepID=UPI00254707E9|nr:uncharacterized protein N7483_012384 [Penicillium malachiteum]KAJ5715203.1 hypothetical protein N7483_012384 [Penicillium malachiteum]
MSTSSFTFVQEDPSGEPPVTMMLQEGFYPESRFGDPARVKKVQWEDGRPLSILPVEKALVEYCDRLYGLGATYAPFQIFGAMVMLSTKDALETDYGKRARSLMMESLHHVESAPSENILILLIDMFWQVTNFPLPSGSPQMAPGYPPLVKETYEGYISSVQPARDNYPVQISGAWTVYVTGMGFKGQFPYTATPEVLGRWLLREMDD